MVTPTFEQDHRNLTEDQTNLIKSGTETIWAAKDRTTGKDYVIDPNCVNSVINESASKTPLGIFDSNKEDKIYCRTFWGLVKGPRTTKPLEREDLGLA